MAVPSVFEVLDLNGNPIGDLGEPDTKMGYGMIDIPNLQPGKYYLSVRNSEGTYSDKFDGKFEVVTNGKNQEVAIASTEAPW